MHSPPTPALGGPASSLARFAASSAVLPRGSASDRRGRAQPPSKEAAAAEAAGLVLSGTCRLDGESSLFERLLSYLLFFPSNVCNYGNVFPLSFRAENLMKTVQKRERPYLNPNVRL